MSTVNEQAQPNPGDQPSPADAPAAAATTQTPIEVTDPDEIELREAQAAAKAEEAAAQVPAAETVNGNAAPQPAAGTQPQDQGQPARVPTIPKPRFDEVAIERDKAKEQAAYWRGVAEARGQQGQPAAPGQQQTVQPTPEQRLAEIDTAVDALAVKFDAGEITMADFKKQERTLQAQAHTIREGARAPQPAAAAPEGGGGDALYLETLTAELEAKHPWVNVFDQVGTPADWKYLETGARERLAARGVEIKGTIGSYNLRKEIAALTDELGPALLTTRAKAKGLTLPGQPSPQPGQQQQKPLSPEAQNRLNKLETQSNAPPNIAAMQGSSGQGVPDASIEHMTDDEIAALPAATLNRLRLSSA